MSNVGMSSASYNPDNDKDNILLEEIKDDPSPKEKLKGIRSLCQHRYVFKRNNGFPISIN